MDKFNLKQFLIENKLTSNSRMISEIKVNTPMLRRYIDFITYIVDVQSENDWFNDEPSSNTTLEYSEYSHKDEDGGYSYGDHSLIFFNMLKDLEDNFNYQINIPNRPNIINPVNILKKDKDILISWKWNEGWADQ